VIGAMLVSEAAVSVVGEVLEEEDFYSETNRLIYRAMTRLYSRGEPIDQLTLAEELRGMGELDRIGGRGYIFQIVESVPTAANVGRYAEIVRSKALLRAVIDAATRITEDAYREPEDVSEALDAAEQLIYGVSNRTLSKHLSPVSELAPNVLDQIQHLYDLGGPVTGVETGFEDLDRLTTGFHRSDLIILAARPAMGKCLKWDSLVVDPESGERLTIEECVKRRLPRVLNVSNAGELQTASVSGWIDSGVKPCFRVTTRTGRKVEVTGHHPFLTAEGWKPLHDLGIGSRIAVPRSLPVFGGDESLPMDRVRLLAYFVAEGGLTRPCPEWAKPDPALIEDFKAAISRQFPEVVVRWGIRGDCEIVGYRREGEDAVTAWLREIGLTGKCAEGESFPRCVWRWSRRYLAEFLRVLFSCGGTIYRSGNRPRIGFSAGSEGLARDVHHALVRFGIVSELWREKEGCWRVEITAPDAVLRYQAEIGWMGEKALRFAEPGCYGPRAGRDLPAARLGECPGTLDDEALERSASPDILWDEIVAIEPTGEHRVYDLTVPDGSNFIAQDICVHNTAMALNIIQHVAERQRLPVAIFSLEMSKQQLVQRLIAQKTRIKTQDLRNGNVEAGDWPKLMRGVAEISEAPIWIDDTAGVTLMEIRAKVRRLASQLNSRGAQLGLVVVDYLQLMVGQNRENRQQEIAEISRGLKVLARDLDVPVLAIAQLSRAVEQRHDKRPMLSDLRDSGSIEQDADMVIFLYRDEYYNPDSDDKGIAEVIVGKHRNGPTGKVQLAWLEQYTKFASLARGE
jgi:replicative DNA helicase